MPYQIAKSNLVNTEETINYLHILTYILVYIYIYLHTLAICTCRTISAASPFQPPNSSPPSYLHQESKYRNNPWALHPINVNCGVGLHPPCLAPERWRYPRRIITFQGVFALTNHNFTKENLRKWGRGKFKDFEFGCWHNTQMLGRFAVGWRKWHVERLDWRRRDVRFFFKVWEREIEFGTC